MQQRPKQDVTQDFFDSLRPPIESVLLMESITLESNQRVLDIGCGNGYLPLRLLHHFPQASFVGIDIINSNVMDARQHLQTYRTLHPEKAHSSVEYVLADATTVEKMDEGFDVIVCNPPFFETSASWVSPKERRGVARHDVSLTLAGMYQCASVQLKTEGVLYAVLPMMRLEDARQAATDHGFNLKTILHDSGIRKRNGGIVVFRSLCKLTK